MRSPIFGPYEVSRSTNASDNQLINLYPEIIETRQGKAVGALYSVPGLTKLATLGAGPIRGLHVLGGKRLFAVSGNGLYQLDQSFNATLIATVPGSGNVKFIDNGTQIALFIGNVGFVAPPGYFLTGGTIGSGGAQYAVNDEITLRANDGSQVATAIALVTAVTGGAVTSFTFLQEGSFPVKPTGFTQASTTGSGSGFTITAPTYTAQTGLFPIRMPYTNSDQPISCAYQDGFGVINQPGSNLWFQSDLLDLSIWDPLNFASASGDPDDVLAIAMVHREMWLIKQFETEVWYNAGTVGFTFARLEGVYLQGGIIAINSLAQSNETLLWLAQTKTGVGIVVQTAGHALRRVSTHAIEVQIQKATPAQMMAATAFTYQQQGHEFYVLNVADNTWVYDITDSEKAGIPLWHQRASFGSVSGVGVGASTSGVGPPAPQPPPNPPSPPPSPSEFKVFQFLDAPVIYGASDDGVSSASVLCGAFAPTVYPTPPLGDTAAGIWTDFFNDTKSITTSGFACAAMSCSRDGTVLVGRDDGLPPGDPIGGAPCFWLTADGSQHPLPVLANDPDGNTDATGVINGGGLIVGKLRSIDGIGNGQYLPGYWLAVEGYSTPHTLPFAAGNNNSWASGVSSDGTCIVGSINRHPKFWNGITAGSATDLALIVGTVGGDALRCTDLGGLIIVGYCIGSPGNFPCWWKKSDQTVTELSLVDQNNVTYQQGVAADCSSDGSLIGGFVQSATNTFPAIWSLIGGTLTVLPLPSGATNAAVTAMSGDGRVAAGGYSVTNTNAWQGVWWSFDESPVGSSLEIHRALPDNAVFLDAEVTGFNNITVVGDFSNGNLYKLDLDALTDNGQPRKWVRSWRALPQPVENPVSFHKLRVDMETGNAAIDPNTDPQVVLRWSDDGGHTWSNEIFENVGKTGETAHRVQFRRLGATRRNHGLDRIFEVSSTDVFPVAIVGADVDVS